MGGMRRGEGEGGGGGVRSQEAGGRRREAKWDAGGGRKRSSRSGRHGLGGKIVEWEGDQAKRLQGPTDPLFVGEIGIQGNDGSEILIFKKKWVRNMKLITDQWKLILPPA
jgi:hypothetical protein